MALGHWALVSFCNVAPTSWCTYARCWCPNADSLVFGCSRKFSHKNHQIGFQTIFHLHRCWLLQSHNLEAGVKVKQVQNVCHIMISLYWTRAIYVQDHILVGRLLVELCVKCPRQIFPPLETSVCSSSLLYNPRWLDQKREDAIWDLTPESESSKCARSSSSSLESLIRGQIWQQAQGRDLTHYDQPCHGLMINMNVLCNFDNWVRPARLSNQMPSPLNGPFWLGNS